MKKDFFIERLEEISDEYVNSQWADTLIEDAASVFEMFEERIAELQIEINNLEEDKEELEDTVKSLSMDLEFKPEDFYIPSRCNDIITHDTIKSLFDNLHLIPILKLKEIVDQYKL